MTRVLYVNRRISRTNVLRHSTGASHISAALARVKASASASNDLRLTSSKLDQVPKHMLGVCLRKSEKEVLNDGIELCLERIN